MSERNLQAIGQDAYDSIEEMITNLNQAREAEDDDAIEAAETAIQEDPLSIQIRDGWYSPGAPNTGPEEYEILLSTGGPATRIIGQLDQHCEPCSAQLQAQDWFEPWTGYLDANEEVLLTYARQFYFGT